VTIGTIGDVIHDMVWTEELLENNWRSDDSQEDKYKDFLISQFCISMNPTPSCKNTSSISESNKSSEILQILPKILSDERIRKES